MIISCISATKNQLLQLHMQLLGLDFWNWELGIIILYFYLTSLTNHLIQNNFWLCAWMSPLKWKVCNAEVDPFERNLPSYK